AWDRHSRIATPSKSASSWWDHQCQVALDRYRLSRSKDDLKAFRASVRDAKYRYFNWRIRKIAEERKSPWELMGWHRERSLQIIQALELVDGQTLHTIDDAFNAFDRTYHSAEGLPVNTDVLYQIPREDCWVWSAFSQLE